MIITNSTQSLTSKSEVLAELNQKPVLVVDVETVSATDHSLLGLAFAWSPTDSVYFTANDPDLPLYLLSAGNIVFHNVLFDKPVLEEHFPPKVGYLGDTMLLAQSLGYPAALGDLAQVDYFNFNHRHITDLLYNETGKKIPKRTLKDCEIQEVAKICSEHAMGTYKIWMALKDKAPASYHLDMDLIPLILRMHQEGIRVDTELAKEKSRELQQEEDSYRQLCEGLGFNPGSPQQIGLALSEAGIFTYIKRGGKQMVTDAEALRPYMDATPIVPLVLKFREKNKLNSNYVKPLLLVDRVYPQYHIVRTGRFASAKPNIQNQPDEIRVLFLPDEGDFWWDADLHQIEPLLMAILSGDKKMLSEVSTGDIYNPIAMKYRVKRYTAKQLVLAGAYGAGAQTLVDTAADHDDVITVEEGWSLLSQFKKDYPRLVEWGDEERAKAKSIGYTTTLLGRVRTLESMAEDEEDGYDPLLKVVNTKVQGSASDVLKLGMKALQQEKVRGSIHDEILVSTDKMIDTSALSPLAGIPVHWTVKTGASWGQVS